MGKAMSQKRARKLSRDRERRGRLRLELLEPRRLLAGFQSDDFNSFALNTTLWEFVNPAGDSAVSLDGLRAVLSVPGGQSHDESGGANQTPRLMQSIDNTDFELEAKFEDFTNVPDSFHGILVEQDADDYLRFEFVGGTTGLDARVVSVLGGTSTVVHQDPIVSTDAAAFLRITRAGDQWTQAYSIDGNIWTESVSFTQAIVVSAAGVAAGNEGATSAPDFSVAVDYTFNTLSPVEPEDGLVLDSSPPVIADVQSSSTSNSLTVEFMTDDITTAVIEYGETLQFEIGSVISTEPTQSHAFTVENLEPLSLYRFRVRATNASGLTSLSGDFFVRTDAPIGQELPLIDLWYGTNYTFGTPGDTQRWVNIPGRVIDSDGISALTYSLNGGPELSLSIGPNGTRLEGVGDFNVEIDRADLVAGVNSVLLTATDSTGAETVQTLQIVYEDNSVWPHEFLADWNSANSVSEIADVVDGFWVKTELGVRTFETGYDRLLALGNAQMSDYEVEVPITIHGYDSDSGPAGPPGVGLITRWYGHDDDGSQPHVKWWPLGGLGWYRSGKLQILGNNGTRIGTQVVRSIPIGATHIFKMRVETIASGDSIYSLKVWEEGSTEPESWDVSGVGPSSDRDDGSIVLVAHFTDATFGNVVIEPIRDGTIPGVTVTSETDTNSVSFGLESNELVTWRIDYGLTGDFELGTVQVADPSLLTTSHIVGLDPGQNYQVRLVATDLSGEQSLAQILTVTTLIDLDPPTSEITVVPTIDAIVVNIDTDELATVVVQYGLTDQFELGSVGPTASATSHELTIGGLSAETAYYLRVVATDSSGNSSTSDLTASTLASDLTAPVISNVQAEAGLTSLTLSALTDESATVVVQYGLTDQFELGSVGPTASATSHELTIGGLSAETAYYLRVVATDSSGNSSTSDLTASTLASDLTAPVISNVQAEAGLTSLTLSALTDESATVVVQYGLTDQFELGAVGPTASATSHELTIGGLSAETAYYLRVVATDSSGNSSTSDLTASTLASDLTAPVISNVQAEAGLTSLTLSALTDESATVVVQYGMTDQFELGSVGPTASATSHELTIGGLSAETAYYLRVVATDSSGNSSTSDLTASTLASVNWFRTVSKVIR